MPADLQWNKINKTQFFNLQIYKLKNCCYTPYVHNYSICVETFSDVDVPASLWAPKQWCGCTCITVGTQTVMWMYPHHCGHPNISDVDVPASLWAPKHQWCRCTCITVGTQTSVMWMYPHHCGHPNSDVDVPTSLWASKHQWCGCTRITMGTQTIYS